ncbi:MAG TPA: TetR family transcriptional regulator [Candidatus Dormibacteraeota bacterium]|nr:TetR family transcriptional regulator [Candidatus Dormibacteraeota bacterium]
MASVKPAKRPRPDGQPAGTIGLRERKKQKTRELIQRTALRLFEKEGYEQTTVEQIAAAVEISPSTFFNYFPTKEDVVLYDAYDPMAIRMFLERPKDEPLNVGLRQVLEGLAAVFQRDEHLILARGRLFLEVPELRARLWDEAERTQVLIAQLLAERTGRRPDDFELRVTARVVTGAMLEASLEWMRTNGRHGLVELVNRALDVLESGARLSLLSAGVRRPVAASAAPRGAHPRPRPSRARARSAR